MIQQIQQITTYMSRPRNDGTRDRVVRVSTTRQNGTYERTYETMVFEGDGYEPVQDRGGDYCETGYFATSLHQAAINRFWNKGFRTLRTESKVV